jgi:hypothetical protein
MFNLLPSKYTITFDKNVVTKEFTNELNANFIDGHSFWIRNYRRSEINKFAESRHAQFIVQASNPTLIRIAAEIFVWSTISRLSVHVGVKEWEKVSGNYPQTVHDGIDILLSAVVPLVVVPIVCIAFCSGNLLTFITHLSGMYKSSTHQ